MLKLLAAAILASILVRMKSDIYTPTNIILIMHFLNILKTWCYVSGLYITR